MFVGLNIKLNVKVKDVKTSLFANTQSIVKNVERNIIKMNSSILDKIMKVQRLNLELDTIDNWLGRYNRSKEIIIECEGDINAIKDYLYATKYFKHMENEALTQPCYISDKDIEFIYWYPYDNMKEYLEYNGIELQQSEGTITNYNLLENLRNLSKIDFSSKDGKLYALIRNLANLRYCCNKLNGYDMLSLDLIINDILIKCASNEDKHKNFNYYKKAYINWLKHINNKNKEIDYAYGINSSLKQIKKFTRQ